MWFGDLVTMRWFDDVWMKEVFANFMASKIVNPSFPQVNHQLRFLLSNYPSAYDVDRTAGANAIRQPLANLNGAGSLYGAIIYQKAPIVMRNLEALMGEDAFRDGLRSYLSKYSFANAAWPDLIAILDAGTSEDLAAWSRAWVEEPGRPTIRPSITSIDKRIQTLSFTQEDPRQRGLTWNQQMQVTLGYADGNRTLPVHLTGQQARPTVPVVAGQGRDDRDPNQQEKDAEHPSILTTAVSRQNLVSGRPHDISCAACRVGALRRKTRRTGRAQRATNRRTQRQLRPSPLPGECPRNKPQQRTGPGPRATERRRAPPRESRRAQQARPMQAWPTCPTPRPASPSMNW